MELKLSPKQFAVLSELVMMKELTHGKRLTANVEKEGCSGRIEWETGLIGQEEIIIDIAEEE